MKEKSRKGDQGAEIIDEMTTKAHEVIHRYKGRRDCFEVRIESGETKRLDFMLIIPTLSNRRPKKKPEYERVWKDGLKNWRCYYLRKHIRKKRVLPEFVLDTDCRPKARDVDFRFEGSGMIEGSIIFQSRGVSH